ncbi:hypothetical protein Cme02nite_64240 [Catellatospora methionotrophica]|uniref:Uncharacterized protein n=1 Tax=Catellatospora methionotrophica TaxID=121620 RepID=A0A8J3PI55_9ACTN|nr:hypothetical protein [Catellatospora methionotrophica]GIG18092.1 hypothetical protein Cme02nite_64240 [Catellatospora methionotrophica]
MLPLQPLALALTLTASLLAGPAAAPTPAPAPSPLPQGDQPVRLDPARFTTRVDNPYLPLAVGGRWSYLATGPDGDVRTEVTVAPGPDVAGIATVAMRSVSTDAGGGLIGDLTGWYAQDGDGNVWLLGESARDYAAGTLTGVDGWQAGAEGAQAGVAMAARPVAGQSWRIAYSRGRAEDTARVLSVGEQVSVAAGAYRDVIAIEQTSPLERGVRLRRLYAPQVGLVRSETSAADRTDLVAYRKP